MRQQPSALGRRAAAPANSGPDRRLHDPAPASAQSWLTFTYASWWQKLSRGRSVLMLDYDGTLAPFVQERMEAKPYPGVCERLLLLAASPSIRLVLISGRPAPELLALLPSTLKTEIWGSHGRERLNPDGGYAAVPLRSTQQKCLAQLESELRGKGFGDIIEKKIGSLAVHTRGLPEAETLQVESIAQEFYCSVSENQQDFGLEWLPFDGGLELRGTGYTKATAVHSVLRDELPRTPAAYLGDDLTDEDAFVALRACADRNPGLPVLVRLEPRPSAAELWLRPPDQLLAFLDGWLAAASPGDPE